jgi:hypothetical protein
MAARTTTIPGRVGRNGGGGAVRSSRRSLVAGGGPLTSNRNSFRTTVGGRLHIFGGKVQYENHYVLAQERVANLSVCLPPLPLGLLSRQKIDCESSTPTQPTPTQHAPTQKPETEQQTTSNMTMTSASPADIDYSISRYRIANTPPPTFAA